VIYTGDYRAHGHTDRAFRRFLDVDMGKIDLLITEGTQAAVLDGQNEKDVMRDIERHINDNDCPAYALCSGQNIALLSSLGAIAERMGRYLVVDSYIALVLETLKGMMLKRRSKPLNIPGLDKDYLKVTDIAIRSVRKYYPECTDRIMEKLVDWKWVNSNLDRAIIPVRTTSKRWIKKEIKNIKTGILIYSMWEGYLEEEGYIESVKFFQNKGIKMKAAHILGHAYFSTIKKLVENKKPGKILPVHTEHPEIFQQEFGDNVLSVKNGDTIEI